MKTAIWDIESSALEAIGAGFMICSVIKPEGRHAKVFRYDELHCKAAHEKKLVQAVVDELLQYDVIVGHNVYKFDWNFLKSRAQVFGIEIPHAPLVYDTLQAFRRCGFLTRPNSFGKPTAKLSFIVDFLGIKQEKTAIYPREHWKTVWATGIEREDALDELVRHCVADVEMTEKVYRSLFAMDGAAVLRRFR